MRVLYLENTAQKMKLSIKGFFSKCDQVRSFLPIWWQLLKKSLMENFIFCAVEGSGLKSTSYLMKLYNTHKSFKYGKCFRESLGQWSVGRWYIDDK